MAQGATQDPWGTCRSVASELAEPDAWRHALALALHEALPQPNVAAVITCALDRVDAMRMTAAPRHEFMLDFGWEQLPLMVQAGWSWQDTYEQLGQLYRAVDALPPGPAAALNGMLERSGMTSCVIAILVTSDRRCAGWFAIHTRIPEAEVIAIHGAELAAVARAATETIEQALTLAREAGAEPPPEARPLPSATPWGLTLREWEIARRVAAGMSDLNIASQLGISESTVGSHLHRIYRKLGVRRRVQLAARVRGAGSSAP
jgi:DNA-binding CsgD family transcriptional regulator